MNFPVELSKTWHKAGGRIARIYGIEHETAKPEDGRSRDVWYFRGDIEWRDGPESERAVIYPYQLCYGDDDRSEIDALLEELNRYLSEHGDWYRTGPHEGWYANDRPAAGKRKR